MSAYLPYIVSSTFTGIRSRSTVGVIAGSGNESSEENNASLESGMDEVVFDLSQVQKGDICRFVVRCSRECLKGVSFNLDDEVDEVPLKAISSSGDLWLLEFSPDGHLRLQVKTRQLDTKCWTVAQE